MRGDYTFGLPCLALVERFADADHHRQPFCQGGSGLGGDQPVAFTMRLPPFGMTKQHHAGTAGCQHGCRYIASMRTRYCIVAVLPAKQDTAAVKAHRHLHQIGRRRE